MTQPAILQPALRRLGPTAVGILLMIVAVLSFTILDAAAKSLVDRYHVVQVVWARIGLQLVLVALILRGRLLPLSRTRFAWLHTARAVTQVAAGGFFFASLLFIGLAEATALADLSPILITLGAALFLGERLGPHRIAGVLAAMGGATLIIRPGAEVFTPAALLPLGCAAAYAANALLTRAVGAREDVWTAMIWTSAIGTALLTLPLPWVWTPVAAADLWLFGMIGACGTFSQLCLIRAFALSEASAIAPFSYLGILFATLWGFVFFGELPDAATAAGAVVIAAAGLYVWHRETRAGRPR
jgi:drug/metabolite transporter (DMT)-like permease